MANSDIAALFGNGVTISYNPQATLPKLTERIHEKLEVKSKNGVNFAEILRSFATSYSLNSNPDSNFEDLLGPLDVLTTQIAYLSDLADTYEHRNPGGTDNPASSIRETLSLLEDIQRVGKSLALEQIENETRAEREKRGALDKFISDLVDARDGATLCIANLNYDTLVLSSLLTHHRDIVCDMAKGNDRRNLTGLADSSIAAFSLRRKLKDLNVSGRPVKLLHLHGSLTWWQRKDEETFAITTEDLRSSNLLERWRQGKCSDFSPAVVLTNQGSKSALIEKAPFVLGYEAFEKQLEQADRWLVAGYSFRDDCVNSMLERVSAKRTLNPPKILVVGHDDSPSDSEVEAHLDPRKDGNISVFRDGLSSLLGSPEWDRFLKNR